MVSLATRTERGRCNTGDTILLTFQKINSLFKIFSQFVYGLFNFLQSDTRYTFYIRFYHYK